MGFDLSMLMDLIGMAEDGENVIADREKNLVTVYKDRFCYMLLLQRDSLIATASRVLTKKPNYMLLSDINNQIHIGAHKVKGDTYFFELVVRTGDITHFKEEFEIYKEYLIRHARQGYEILNTTSELKRSQLLMAHQKNMPEEQKA